MKIIGKVFLKSQNMGIERVTNSPYKGVVLVDKMGNSAIIEGSLLFIAIEALCNAEGLTMSQLLERNKDEIKKFFDDPVEETKELETSEGA